MEQLIAGALLSAMQFLGIEWGVWKVIGWLGNIAFSLRFFVQWYATEKQKQVVIPQAFWWLSLVGSLLLLLYAIFHKADSVFIFAYAFTWIPYIRNLMVHRKTKKQRITCHGCETIAPPKSNYCPHCGQRISALEPAAAPTAAAGGSLEELHRR